MLDNLTSSNIAKLRTNHSSKATTCWAELFLEDTFWTNSGILQMLLKRTGYKILNIINHIDFTMFLARSRLQFRTRQQFPPHKNVKSGTAL